MLGADEIAKQIRGRHVGEHGPAGVDDFPRVELDPGGSTVAHPDPVHRAIQPNDATPGGEPADERVGQPARPAFRHRKTVCVPHHRQQPAVDRTTGRVRWQIGVQRVAGQQHRPTGAAKGLLAKPPHRQRGQPSEPERRAEAQPSHQPLHRHDRREGPKERVEHQRLRSPPTARTAASTPARRPREKRRASGQFRRGHATGPRSDRRERHEPGRRAHETSADRTHRDRAASGRATPPTADRTPRTDPTDIRGLSPRRSAPLRRCAGSLHRPRPPSRHPPAGWRRPGRCAPLR